MDELKRIREKKETQRALQAAEWELSTYECSSDIKVTIYLYDALDSEEMFLACLGSHDLDQLSSYQHEMPDVIDSIESAFQAFIKKQLPYDQAANVLGNLLGLYMLNTKTYAELVKQADDTQLHAHFGVLRYVNYNTRQSSLRPFSFVHAEKFISSEEIKEMARSVIEYDQDRNIEFFNFPKVAHLSSAEAKD
jgi:hypothetical protein